MRGLNKKFTQTAGVTPVAYDNDADDWRAEDDARTLMRAAEIQGHPERHGRAKSKLKAQHMATKRALRHPGPSGDSAESMVAKGYRKLG